MKENSFVRLWGYLKVYKAAVLLAVFLKIVSVVMSVLEPFVLGLAITMWLGLCCFTLFVPSFMRLVLISLTIL